MAHISNLVLQISLVTELGKHYSYVSFSLYKTELVSAFCPIKFKMLI